MPLDRQSAAFVEAMNRAVGPPPFDLAKMRTRAGPPSPAVAALPVLTEERTIPGVDGAIPVRLYRPASTPPTGVLVYFHGGGFVMGDLESADGACRALTHQASCLTISVDYRLAPEHPFPAAVEDAFAATQWAIANASALAGSHARVAVGGDSAGGALAIVACLMSRDRAAPLPAFQLLLYPGVNLKLETPARDALARAGYGLSRELIDWLNGLYCEVDTDFEQAYCAPVYAETLAGLPPALVIVGEFDPLREEDEAFVQRLSAAGIQARCSLYRGTVHGFVTAFEFIDQGRLALGEAAAALRAAFGDEIGPED